MNTKLLFVVTLYKMFYFSPPGGSVLVAGAFRSLSACCCLIVDVSF